jgi:L-fuconolactonase
MFDIHPHVISKDTEKYPIAPLGGKRSAWSVERPADVDDLLAQMDKAQVARAAVVQSATTYGNDNSYLADVVDAHRDRLTGVGTVDLVAPDAVERLTYWLEDRGLAGIRLFTSGSTMTNQSDWMNAEETNPAWEYLNRTRYPVCVQMRPPGIPMLRDVLGRFPDLRIIVDNAARVDMSGGPSYLGAQPLFDLATAGEVYVKVTTNTLRRAVKEDDHNGAAGFMRALIGAFGSNRVAWGSDFPAMAGSMTEFVALARESVAGLPETDQTNFFDKTASALYPEVPCES